MQNLYKCTVVAKESTKTKQTITNNDLVVDLPTKILDENINFLRWFHTKHPSQTMDA
jgi:hypothetical protein